MESTQSILFIASEKHTPGLTLILPDALARAGYQVMIGNIAEIESVITLHSPALIIASLPGDPELDLQLCYLLLRRFTVLVIVIGSLDDVENRIAALDAGIADYLVSPISPSILAARARNILKRRSQNTARREKPVALCH